MKMSMRIRVARQRGRFSQEKLALALGVTRGAVANWECSDSVLPASARLAKLAEVTGVAYEWLATGRGPMSLALHAEPQAVEGVMVYEEQELRLLDAFRRLDAVSRQQLILLSEANLPRLRMRRR